MIRNKSYKGPQGTVIITGFIIAVAAYLTHGDVSLIFLGMAVLVGGALWAANSP